MARPARRSPRGGGYGEAGGRRAGRNGNGNDAGLRAALIALLTSQFGAQAAPPPSPPPPPPPPAPPTSQSTSNFELDTRQVLRQGEQLLGQVHPDRVMQVLIQIKPSGDKLIEDAIALSSQPLSRRAYLTREEYATRYGAKIEDVSRVVRYYTMQYGLRAAPNWSNRLRGAAPFADRTIVFNGRAGDLSEAFGVAIFRVRGKDGGLYTTYLGGLKVPSELRDIVSNVTGLDTRPVVAPHLRLSQPLATGTQRPAAYTPTEVAQAYGFPINVTGKGVNIAILELGGGARLGDLIRYFNGLGLQVPRIRPISVGGNSNAPTGDPTGPDGEVTLDIEVAGAIANGADFSVYFAPNTGAGFLQGVNAAIQDAVNKPSILSISWGGPETQWTQADMNAINEAFAAAAQMGISVFVAAGDSGSTDGVGLTTPDVDFPAASPWATACGGTSLYTGASAPPEKVWNDGTPGGATGGGISTKFPAPSYQSSVLFQSVPLSGRGLPDVAGCADPNTGYKVLIDGVEEVFGGTSAVAPLWSALTALLTESTGKPLGFINPLLYQGNLRGALKDITVGNNDQSGLVGKYSAATGWDPCSGFGSPNGAAILAALS
jgi:kumamolisin